MRLSKHQIDIALTALCVSLVYFIPCECKAQVPETVTIGLMAGFNSVLAEEARQIKNGAQLAIKHIQSDSSKTYKFEVKERDTQLNPELAVQAFLELTQGPGKVDFIVGPQSSSEIAKISPLTRAARVLLISPSARSNDVSVQSEYVFRTRHSQEQESEFFAPYILNATGKQPLHTLILSSMAGYSFARAFRPAFTALGGTFGLFEDLMIDRPNYPMIVGKLKNAGAKYVYVVSLSVQVADIMSEAEAAGLGLQFFGTSDTDEQVVLRRAGALKEGYTFPYAFAPERDSNAAAFASAYRGAFGSSAQQAAANAYDAVMLLSQCIEKVGSSADAVKSCLFYVRSYPGAGGQLSIDRNGISTRPLRVKMIKNGAVVNVTPLGS